MSSVGRDRHVELLEPIALIATDVLSQRAVVAGLGEAVKDASQIAAILRQDYDFRLLPDGEPLLAEKAGLTALRKSIEEGLDGCAESRCLLYFAGQGAILGGRGFLLPADAVADDPTTCLAVDELVESCRRSRCAEILLVLDAGDVGQVWIGRSDLAPWFDSSQNLADLGTIQILASAAPLPRDEDRSVITGLLLSALEGSAGVHADDGSVRFTPLSTHLEDGIVESLRERGETVARPPLSSKTSQQSTRGSLRGDFRFVPRWPRLSPKIVRGVRSSNDEERCRCLARLPAACQEGPEEIVEKVERLKWNLPLAVRLALRDLPQGPLEEALTSPPQTGVERQVRRQAAQTLGDLGELRHDLSPADAKELDARSDLVETLLHLAVRNPAAAVRHEARKSLVRALDAMGRLATSHRLGTLGRGAPGRIRRRLWHGIAVLDPSARRLDPVRRVLAFWTRAGLDLGAAGRRLADRLPLGRLAAATAILLTVFYLFLAAHYHLSVDRFRNVVVRWGPPGLEAVPGVGLPAIVTAAHATDLLDPTAVTEERLSGRWLPRDGGLLPWGRQLAAQLRPDRAALAFWRLGDSEKAVARLVQGITQGDKASVRTGVYLSLFSDELFPSVIDHLLAAFERGDDNLRQEVLAALESLSHVHPRPAATLRTELVGRLEEAPAGERLRWIEAISALGTRDPEALAAAFPFALELARDESGPIEERRRKEALRRLLAAHPRWPAGSHEEIAALALRAPRGRELVVELLAEHPAIEALVAFAGDDDPDVVLTAAGALAALPEGRAAAVSFRAPLEAILHHESVARRRARAVELLAALTRDTPAPGVSRALLAAARDADAEVREAALGASVRLALAGRMAPAELEPFLGRALEDRSPWLRRQAVEGILLLADRVDTHFAVAIDRVGAELATFGGWQRAEEYGRLFERSTDRAAARFAYELLLWLAAHEPEEKAIVFEAVLAVLEVRPEVLPDLVPALAVLLATPRDATGKAFETAWYLRKLQYGLAVDVTPIAGGFLALLDDDPSLAERRAAVYVLGQLVKGSPELAGRGLRELEQAAADPDPELAARAAYSLGWLAEVRPELSAQVWPLLFRGLGREQVRPAFASALAEAAEGELLDAPATLPEVLRDALGDHRPEVRQEVARGLGSLSRRSPAVAAGWLDAQLERETDARVRLELAAALGRVAGDDPEVAERVIHLALARMRRSAERELVLEAIDVLQDLAQAQPSRARRVVRLLRDRRQDLDPQLHPHVMRVLGWIGRAHPAGGEASLDVLETILREEENAQVQWDAVVNGLKAIASMHPDLNDKALAIVVDFLTDGSRQVEDHVASAAWDAGVEMAVVSAARDPKLLWRLFSAPGGGYRQAGLEVLIRLLEERPDLLSPIQAGLEERRESVHPHLRHAIAMARETIEILRQTEERRTSPQEREGWRKVLDTLPSRVGTEAALGEARRRLDRAGS